MLLHWLSMLSLVIFLLCDKMDDGCWTKGTSSAREKPDL